MRRSRTRRREISGLDAYLSIVYPRSMTHATPSDNRGITIAPVVDVDGLGKAMLALNPQQRAFVVAYTTIGGTSAQRAAGMAGYGGTEASTKTQSYRLMHDERILAAIREEATKRISGSVLLGASVLVEIASDVMHKDRLKAASALLDRGGMMLVAQSNLNINVTHQSNAEVKDQIREVALRLGLDPTMLLGGPKTNDKPVIDAEFTEVHPAAASGLEGLEDIL